MITYDVADVVIVYVQDHLPGCVSNLSPQEQRRSEAKLLPNVYHCNNLFVQNYFILEPP